MFKNLTIVPEPTAEVVNSRSGRDDYCFTQGKDDALAELPRDAGVHYTTQRDIDCYNMGYSAGEI